MTGSKLSATKLALAARSLWQQDGALRVAEPVAIVGMAMRFPDGVHDPEALWRVLIGGEDHIREVPEDRWDLDEWYDADPATPGRISTRFGGFIEDIRGFDAAFFDISPREAERMDPQQRMALEVACEAIERAGVPLSEMRGSATGVYFSSYHNDYAFLQYSDLDTVSGRTLTGSLHSLIPNRISYALGLRGPSMTVDSACSSSLVSCHLACQALRGRDCDMALVGGVNLMITPHVTVTLSKGGFMSPTGHCHTFDAAADGFVRSDGCAVIVLKRLSDAIAAGDRVLGVIRGSAVNQDGTSTTLSAPNGLAQAELVKAALRNAGLTADDISVLEAHGTGTELGDPIETDALAEVFATRSRSAGPCWIGSLKSNFGHMEAAAGLAGLIKSVLVLQKGVVPPHALFSTVNPHLNLDGTALTIARAPTPLTAPSPRRAGVSGFGVGGTNAHVIVEEPPAALEPPLTSSPAPWLLPMSARSAPSLNALAGRYRDLLRAGADPGAVVRATARRRAHYAEHRAGITASTAEALMQELDRLASGVRSGSAPKAQPQICFVFSGQGTQWPGMALGLRKADAVFAAELVRIDAAFAAAGGQQPIAELERSPQESRLDRTDVAQVTMFAVQAALLKVLTDRGIRPSIVIGHSSGELAAAYAAGLLSLDDAVRAVLARGTGMQRAFDTGRMVAVRLTEDAALDLLQRHRLNLVVAAVNGPASVVLSGATEDVTTACSALRDSGVQHSLLDVRFGFHSELMDQAAAGLRDAGRPVTAERGDVAFLSTVTGREQAEFDYDYLARNVREPVRFHDAVRAAVESGVRHFVEIGPHPALGNAIVETAEAAGVAAEIAFCQHRERDASEALLSLTARAYEWGSDLDWSAVYPGPCAPVDLPTYPWTHVPHWLPDNGTPNAHRSSRSRAGFPGREISSPALSATVFELDADDGCLDAFADHVVGGAARIPATALLELLRSAGVTAGLTKVVVRDAGLVRAVEPQSIERIQVVLARDGNGAAEIVVRTRGGEWLTAVAARLGGADDDAHERAASLLRASSDVETAPGLSPDGLYQQLADSGITFGPGYRLLDDIRANGAAAAGTIATDRAQAWTGAVNPALMDAAAHLCIAVLAARDGRAPSPAMLPWAADAYHLLSAGIPARARAVLREGSGGGASFDVFLLSAEGSPIAWLEGWHLRKADLEAQTLRASVWEAQPAPARAIEPGRWLIIDDQRGTAAAAASGLRRLGHTTEFVSCDIASVQARLEDGSWRGVLHVATDASPEVARGAGLVEAALSASEPLLAIARLGVDRRAGTRCVVVTRGAQIPSTAPVNAASVGAAALGTLRALRAEAPEVECTAIDLDAPGAAALADDAERIIDELLAAEPAGEVAVRDGIRFVARSAMEDLRPAQAAERGSVQLVHAGAGTLDGFVLRPQPESEVPPAHVRIRVLAAGLNFRDVLIALGTYPDPDAGMGLECCGVVIECGEGAGSFRMGDRVLAFWPGCFASEVIVPVEFVHAAPRSLTPAEAATLPVAYGTAWHALFDVGRLEAGQAVLIHAGAGGVGHAAIRLAQMRGARVYATAGSDAKRAFLLDCGVAGAFDSRSPSFARDLLAVEPAGVQLVLNSLIGDLIPAGMSCLRPNGVFVELGKREILSRDEQRGLRPDVRYHAFDLRDVTTADATVLPRMFAGISTAIDSGAITPLPAVTLPMSDAAAGFRRMARAQHMGKIVFIAPTFGDAGSAGWTIITGGTGGMGEATLRWALECGARRVAVWSRSGSAPAVSERLDAIANEFSAELIHTAVDAADARAVDSALADLRVTDTITGIIHAAGVLRDGTLAQLTPECGADVLRPKIAGAWNLHRATLADPIRMFVLYSAVGPFVDAAGQGSYAAANAFLDTLAVQRRTMGMPAVSIRWGLFAGGGMAERLDAAQQLRWERKGLDWLDAGSGSAAFRAALCSVDPQVFAVRLARGSAGADAVRSNDATADSGLVERLRALPAGDRFAAALDYVASAVTAMLGLSAPADPDAPLRDVGLDSLSAIELRNALTVATGSPLPATLAFDHPTAAAIARFLIVRLGLEEVAAVDAPVAFSADDIDALTDDEAEAQLLAELALLRDA